MKKTLLLALLLFPAALSLSAQSSWRHLHLEFLVRALHGPFQDRHH